MRPKVLKFDGRGLPTNPCIERTLIYVFNPYPLNSKTYALLNAKAHLRIFQKYSLIVLSFQKNF